MRVAVTGGGTGGHVYPALSVIEELLADPRWGVSREDVLWFGESDSIEERLMQREAIAFQSVSSGPLRGMSPWRMARSGFQVIRGWFQCRRYLARFRPDVILSTGGYVSAPLILAAGRVPVIIYLPDMVPGVAIKRLASRAKAVAVSFDSVAGFFDNAIVTGYPVRRALVEKTRAEARDALGITADEHVLLVLGGSRGARSLNQAVARNLNELLASCVLIHVTGPLDYDEAATQLAGLSQSQATRYRLYDYVHEGMENLLLGADLVVARAGAATLAEFPVAGLPAILVPYPYSGQHQRLNADFLGDKGAAVVVDDGDIGEQLSSLVSELLSDRARLQTMREKMNALAVRDAAERIAGLMTRFAQT